MCSDLAQAPDKRVPARDITFRRGRDALELIEDRRAYVVHGPDEFEEIFELAQSGRPFALYSRARLKRVQ